MMNMNEAKQIRIEEYLHSLGYSPVRQQGGSLWYNSPFRDEQEPSFKVNTERNLWYDFGAGKGGNIIALAQELYASDSLPYLLERIAEQAPRVRPVSFSFGKQPLSKPSFRQLEVVSLSSPALLSYLRQRGINTELAKRECREVRYLTNGKPYFAIGFPNRSEGYEIRNNLFKGCIAPKDITHIQQEQPKATCYLFEGFMDYLSFLTLRLERCPDRPNLDRTELDFQPLQGNPTIGRLRVHPLFPRQRQSGNGSCSGTAGGIRAARPGRVAHIRRLQRPERLPTK